MPIINWTDIWNTSELKCTLDQGDEDFESFNFELQI